ncbi:MAG TPA: methionyl-tRNA formyltransferase [Terriglobales bacterium]|jgi:methionyl-tRNA formyltransferase|nr:methionyl-tRNA formyltransferase [Terriglobales bacterium]
MPTPLKLVFCGTPNFAVPTLEKLVEAGHSVPLVVTQPDRPRGRGMEVAVSPVKDAAVRLGIAILQPATIKNNTEFRDQLVAIAPDAIIVVGYGRIIPQWMIDLPRLGNLNLHASLLPKYRGAAPIQWAIASGETVTGVTTMRIDAGLDTGDILLQREIPIGLEDTSETLGPKLASIGADLMVETLRGLENGNVRPTPQDHSRATLAPILKKEDGRMDFARTAYDLFNRLRGFQPWPGAFTVFRGKTLQVHRAQPAQYSTLTPSEIAVDGTHLFVGCGKNNDADTTLELIDIQLEGKRRMTAQEFINGYRPKSGDRLGQ